MHFEPLNLRGKKIDAKNSVPVKKKKVKMETTFIKIGKSQGKVLNGAIKRSS